VTPLVGTKKCDILVAAAMAATARRPRRSRNQFDQKFLNLYTPNVPHMYSTPSSGGPPSDVAKTFSSWKIRMIALVHAEESMMIC